MDPKDYALLLGDQSLLIPLDRTVASLQGKRELLLVKRSMLPQYGEDIVRGVGKTTDPNGQCPSAHWHHGIYFLQLLYSSVCRTHQKPNLPPQTIRLHTRHENHLSGGIPFPDYRIQKYIIYRKMPMLVAKQERTLAIDGVYVHVSFVSSSHL